MDILSYSSQYVASGHNAGAETTLHDVNRLLRSDGHHVTALGARPFRDGSGSYVIDGVKVQAYSSRQDPQLYFPRNDIILSQLETSAKAQLIASKYGKPNIQLVHNTTEFSRSIAKHSDGLVFNCRNTERVIRSDGYKGPGCVLYPIIEPKRYRVQPPSLEDGYVTLINLSDGTEPFYDKGYRTFYHLAEHFPDLKFLGVEGAYGRQQIRDLPNVTILPHQNNILEVYRKTSVLLVPSTVESFGRVAVEAATSGIPSISTNLPGPQEAGVSYAYLDPLDFWTWECALTNLLDHYSTASDEAKAASANLWDKTRWQTDDFRNLLSRVR